MSKIQPYFIIINLVQAFTWTATKKPYNSSPTLVLLEPNLHTENKASQSDCALSYSRTLQNTHITVTLKCKDKGLHFLVIFSHVPPFHESWPHWSPCCNSSPCFNILNMFLSHFCLCCFLWLNSFPPRYIQPCFYFIWVSVQMSSIQKGLSGPSYLNSSAPWRVAPPTTPAYHILPVFLLHSLFFLNSELLDVMLYIYLFFLFVCFFQWHVNLPESGILFYFSAVSEAFRTLWNLEKLNYCW